MDDSSHVNARYLKINELTSRLNDIDIENYAYSCQKDCKIVTNSLENTSVKLLTWFINHRMKANPDKYHFLLTGKTELTLKHKSISNKSWKLEKLLGIAIDNKLTFEKHVTNLCNKVSQKLNSLTRIVNYIQPNKRQLIMKAFITSQFGYCPLVRSGGRIFRTV